MFDSQTEELVCSACGTVAYMPSDLEQERGEWHGSLMDDKSRVGSR